MKKMVIFSLAGLGLVLLSGIFSLSAQKSLPQAKIARPDDASLIKKRVSELGFQVGDIIKKDGGYAVHISGFRQLSQAVKLAGAFKPFVLTAKVSQGFVHLDRNELQLKGYVIQGPLGRNLGIQWEEGRLAPTRPSGPDLTIIDVQGVPDSITSLDLNGECPYFFATVTVKNIGTEDAWFPTGSWIIGGPSQYTNISAPGTITNKQTTYNTAIKAGETYTATLAGKVNCLKGQTVTACFKVDPDNRVAESDETNNGWSKQISNQAVPGQDQKPDLVITSVTFTPEKPTHYDRVMIHVEMLNQGPGPAVFCTGTDCAGQTHHGTIWLSQVEGANYGGGGAGAKVILPGQAFGGGLFIVEPNELKAGCYRVNVSVDPDNEVEETNEDNNTRVAYLSIDGGSCEALQRQDSMRIIKVRLQMLPGTKLAPVEIHKKAPVTSSER